MMDVGQDREKHLDFVKSQLTELTSIINNDELIRSLCLQKSIITLDEYNVQPSNWTCKLLVKLLNKGDKACQKFVSQLLKNQKVEETFPRLEELNWTLLDSEPERTSMPDQGPRPERRDTPEFGGHRAPGSSTTVNDFTPPKSMSYGSVVTEQQQQNGTFTMQQNLDDFQRSGEAVKEGKNMVNYLVDLPCVIIVKLSFKFRQRKSSSILPRIPENIRVKQSFTLELIRRTKILRSPSQSKKRDPLTIFEKSLQEERFASDKRNDLYESKDMKLLESPAFTHKRPTPQDIFLKGIAPLVIKCVLEQLVLLEQIDIDKFKATIQDFPESCLEIGDTLSSWDINLHPSPGLTRILLTVLPRVLEPMKNNPFVQIILDLEKISLNIITPVIMPRTGLNVILQIKRFLEDLKIHFPDDITKQDDLIHVPSRIKLLIPLFEYMCEILKSNQGDLDKWLSKLNLEKKECLNEPNLFSECNQNVNDPQHSISSSEGNNRSVLKVKKRLNYNGNLMDSNEVKINCVRPSKRGQKRRTIFEKSLQEERFASDERNYVYEFKDMKFKLFCLDISGKGTLDKWNQQFNKKEKAKTKFLSKSLKKKKGIKIKRQLLESPAFTPERPTPQDIFLKGIAPLVIKCVLEQLVLLEQIDVDKFKATIQDFPESCLEIGDTLSSWDINLHPSPGLTRILLTVLPRVLEPMKNNPFVQIILDLEKISLNIITPVIMPRTGSKVILQIKRFLEDLKKHFPDEITKQDDLIHVPSRIELLIPLFEYMCEILKSNQGDLDKWLSKLNLEKNECLNEPNLFTECNQNANDPQHSISSSKGNNRSVLKVKKRLNYNGNLMDSNEVKINCVRPSKRGQKRRKSQELRQEREFGRKRIKL